MADIVLRLIKGTPLTNQEVDDNFSNINTEVGLKLDAADYTAADVLDKLLTVDGPGSGLNADVLDGLESSSSLPGAVDKSSVVTRDASGNFAAATITANLTGNVSGTAGNVSGTVAIVNGGTGATSIAAAQTNLQVDPAGTAVALAIALG